MNKLNRTLLALPLLVIASGLAVVAAYAWLNPKIIEQQRMANEAIYIDTLQLSQSTDVQLTSIQTTNDSALLGLRSSQPIYIARESDRVIGIALPLTAREGYVGDIDLLLGIDANGSVISVRVIAQRETRGLGDKIERDPLDHNNGNWLNQFNAATFDESQKNQWQLRSDGGEFDGITGATVTSRAVVKAIQQGLAYFAAHRAELLGESSNAK